MAEVFWAVYEAGDTHVEPRVTSVAGMMEHVPAGTVFAGDGAERYRGEILAAMPSARFADSINAYPRAASVALVALDLLNAGEQGDAAAVEPVYLRGSQPEEAKKSTVSA
jgi:tRNA A37 threonylcarbamoyladenosine modification protein TsaB